MNTQASNEAASPSLNPRLFPVALIMGVPVALLAILAYEAIHQAEHVVWTTLPDALGMGSQPAWWYVIATTSIAGMIAALCLVRSGAPAGHTLSIEPVAGRQLAWMLCAALATLAGGIVLGPEAPLLAIGCYLAGIAASTAKINDAPSRTMLAVAGAFIVLSTLLASAIVALVLLIEILARSGRVEGQKLIPSLMPGFVAAGVGLLVFTGVNSWAGLTPPTLTVPSLPAYDTVRWQDVVWMPFVAIAATLVVVSTHRVSARLGAIAQRNWVLFTTLFGAVIGVLAVAYRALTDRDISDVLFSGQTALPSLLEIDSAWVLFAIVIAKGAAYALALSGRFEGGPIFPALATSAALGCAAAIALPGADLVPMFAVAIAAGTTAVQRLPVFGAVFAVIVVGATVSFEVMPLIIIAACLSWMISTKLEQQQSAVSPTV